MSLKPKMTREVKNDLNVEFAHYFVLQRLNGKITKASTLMKSHFNVSHVRLPFPKMVISTDTKKVTQVKSHFDVTHVLLLSQKKVI